MKKEKSCCDYYIDNYLHSLDVSDRTDSAQLSGKKKQLSLLLEYSVYLPVKHGTDL